MKKDKIPPTPPDALRQRAEERLETGAPEGKGPRGEQDYARMVHELQVHKIELELQNEELKRSREEVEAGLERFTDLYDFAPVGYFTLARDGSIRQTNITGARILGDERARVAGRQFEKYVSPEDRSAYRVFLQKAFGERKEACEVTLVKEGGESFAARIEAMGSRDGQECRAVVMDIVERRAAEAQAARRSRRFQVLADALREINSTSDITLSLRRLVASAREVTGSVSGTAGLVTDGKMAFTEYNEAGCTFPIDYRFSPGQGVPGLVMQTREPYVANDAEHDAHVVQEFREALSFHTAADVPILSRDGLVIGCLAVHDKRGGPFVEDDLDMLKGLAAGAAIALEHVRHLQEQKQAEERLREALNRLQATISALPDLLFVVDREGRIYDYHAPSAELLYVAPERFVGRKMGDVLPEPAAGIVSKAIAEAVEQGRHAGGIYALPTLSGKRWFELSIATQGNARAENARLVLLAHDITDIKRGEDESKRTAEDLRRSNRDLEQFAFVAVHDLKEPLRMVTAFLDLLRQRCGEALDAQSLEYISFALEGGMRMQTLIDALLQYARVGLQKIVKPTDLGAVLESVCESLRLLIDESGATITHDPLPTIPGNPEEMAQLFQNLIGNAVKFKGDKKPEIHIGARLQGDRWLMSVRDNGIGIDPKFTDRIFVIFQRLHPREKYPGTGIGLAICRKIVERSGGRIWVESAAGQGATFYFTLPETAGG